VGETLRIAQRHKAEGRFRLEDADRSAAQASGSEDGDLAG